MQNHLDHESKYQNPKEAQLKKINGKMQLKDITAINLILAGETPISQRRILGIRQNKILMSPYSHSFPQQCHQPVFRTVWKYRMCGHLPQVSLPPPRANVRICGHLLAIITQTRAFHFLKTYIYFYK